MNTFSIRDIENLCGIKAHTLRVWEQRYQLCCAKRKASNHRSYDNEDLKYLLRIAYLYHNGHKISRIAQLSEKEICDLALRISTRTGSEEIFINKLTEAAIDFDQERFDRILHNLILQFGFGKTMTRIAFPFLGKIGLLWMTGNVVPAQEHFASSLIIKKMHIAIDGLDMPGTRPPLKDPGSNDPSGSSRSNASGMRTGGLTVLTESLPAKAEMPEKRVLLFAPKGEFHEIPLLYMRYLLKKNGIRTVYFGTDICLEDLQYYCARRPFTHLYFHLITRLVRCPAEDYIKKLAALFPDKKIVMSGSMTKDVRGQYPNLVLLKTENDLLSFAGEKSEA